MGGSGHTKFNGGFEAKRTSRSLAGEEVVNGGLWHGAAEKKRKVRDTWKIQCPASWCHTLDSRPIDLSGDCQLMVISVNSKPTGIPKLGYDEEGNFIQL